MSDFEVKQEDGADEVESGGKSSVLVWAALLLGIAGIAFGITGIYLANQAGKTVAALEAELLARPDRFPELEKAIADVDDRLNRAGGELVKLARADRDLQQNVQSALGSVTREVGESRKVVNELTAKLNELGQRMETARVPARSASPATTPPASGTGSSGEDSPVAEAGVHIIQSGDTLSKIATRYGVTLDALQRANPSVNPRALQIGQRIVIPGS